MSPKPALTSPEPALERADVDDVIGRADELQRSEADALTLDELKVVASELDIEARHVERAVREVEQEKVTAKAEEEARAAEALALRKMAVRVGGGLIGAVALVLLIVWGAAASAVGDLRVLRVEADQKRAQVVNVIERQAKVEAEYRPRPAGAERDAELAGAENRVRVERKRYDEAAAKYNARVASASGGLAVRFYSVPPKLPLSNEVTQW